MAVAPVQIRQQGNLLEVDPPCLEFLDPVLSYDHRNLLHGRDAMFARSAVSVHKVKLYEVVKQKLYVMDGLKGRVFDAFNRARMAAQFHDMRLPRPELTPDPDNLFNTIPNLKFRDGQQETLSIIMSQDHGQIIAPTGWGKSFIVRACACLFPRAKIVVVVPRKSLQEGMYNELIKSTPNVGRIGGGFCEPNRITIVVAASLERAPLDKTDILFVDECHTAASPRTAAILARARYPRKRFGFTATPTGRSDGAELVVEALFGPPVYYVSYDEGVKSGSVVPMRVVMTELTDSEVPACFKTNGIRSRIAKKRRTFWLNSRRNKRLADTIEAVRVRFGFPEDWQVLVLVETFQHLVHMKKYLPGYELMYGTSDSKDIAAYQEAGLLPPDFVPLDDKHRKQLQAEFTAGTLRKVISTKTWDTGVDFTHLNAVVMASGDAGSIPITQGAGRASRINPDKDFGIVIDCGDQYDNWARERARDRLRVYKNLGWRIMTRLHKFDTYQENTHDGNREPVQVDGSEPRDGEPAGQAGAGAASSLPASPRQPVEEQLQLFAVGSPEVASSGSADDGGQSNAGGLGGSPVPVLATTAPAADEPTGQPAGRPELSDVPSDAGPVGAGS